jgi:O-antigen/teichoic acid export membrane protein
LFSEELAALLLGKAFRAGYILMPYIFMATFLHGLSNFFELRLKFSDKIKKLSIIAVITALLNIVLNLIFVSSFGYEWAAYTTVISYSVMILMLVYGDPKVLGVLKEKHKILIELIVLLTIQYLVYIIFVDKMNLENVTRIGIGVIFALVFLIYFRKAISKMELPVN